MSATEETTFRCDRYCSFQNNPESAKSACSFLQFRFAWNTLGDKTDVGGRPAPGTLCSGSRSARSRRATASRSCWSRTSNGKNFGTCFSFWARCRATLNKSSTNPPPIRASTPEKNFSCHYTLRRFVMMQPIPIVKQLLLVNCSLFHYHPDARRGNRPRRTVSGSMPPACPVDRSATRHGHVGVR